MTAYQRAQTDTDAKSHTMYACRSATLLGETEFLLSPRFLKKDVGRPALCWTLGGTTPPESGRWGPWYRLIEAFRSETVGCENFRGHYTNRETEPQRIKGSNIEKALGDIVPPPRSFPLPPSCPFSSSGCWCGYHQLCPLLPLWASLLTLAFILAPRTSVIASSQVPLVPPPLYSQGDLPRSQVRPPFFPPKGLHGITPVRPLQGVPLPHSPPSPRCH